MTPSDEDVAPQLRAGSSDEASGPEESQKRWAVRTAEHLVADWWEIRDGAVRLKRHPRAGESLPQIDQSDTAGPRVGGGRILPVYGPDGALLSYGRSSE